MLYMGKSHVLYGKALGNVHPPGPSGTTSRSIACKSRRIDHLDVLMGPSALNVPGKVLAKHQRSDPVDTLECRSPLEDPAF